MFRTSDAHAAELPRCRPSTITSARSPRRSPGCAGSGPATPFSHSLACPWASVEDSRPDCTYFCKWASSVSILCRARPRAAVSAQHTSVSIDRWIDRPRACSGQCIHTQTHTHTHTHSLTHTHTHTLGARAYKHPRALTNSCSFPRCGGLRRGTSAR